MHEDQKKLVQQAKQGNQKALTELYHQTRHMAFFTAMRYVKNVEDAADVLQNAYIAAFRRLDIFDEARSFEPWLRKIVVNQSLNFLRAQRVIFVDEDQIDEIVDDEGLIPTSYLEQKEKREKILEIVNLLPDGQRLAVTLHYFEGMSVAEIAETMGVKPATAKSHLHFGRKAIKAAVLEEERKGHKLYALLPVPVLTQIFQLEAQGARMPAALSKAVFENIIRELPAFCGSAKATPRLFTYLTSGKASAKALAAVVTLGIVALSFLLIRYLVSQERAIRKNIPEIVVSQEAPV